MALEMAAKYFDIHSTSYAQLLRLRRRRDDLQQREKLINVSERRKRPEFEREWAVINGGVDIQSVRDT